MPKSSYHISLKGYVGEWDSEEDFGCYIVEECYNFYGGWRKVKILSSGECRKIRGGCIFRA